MFGAEDCYDILGSHLLDVIFLQSSTDFCQKRCSYQLPVILQKVQSRITLGTATVISVCAVCLFACTVLTLLEMD